MRNKILRSANAKYHYSYLFFYKINKEDLPLMYSCEFIDLVGFFGRYCLTPVTLFIILRINRWIHTKKQKNMLKVSLLYLFYRKISKNIMIFRVRRSQYFIPHTNSQWLLVTWHRLSFEKVNLHNTPVTWARDACDACRVLWLLTEVLASCFHHTEVI